jgi:hypothetical protein
MDDERINVEESEEAQSMSVGEQLHELLERRSLQLIVLALLLSAVAARAMYLKFSVLDLDIWWHLKVGDWILAHHAFPRVGILSRTAADRPWMAYSWGYELLLSRAYAWFGLVGVGIFGTLLTVAVAYAVYWMIRRICGSFWVACILAVISCSAFLFSIMPRPVFLSMVFYAITLTLLMRSQQTGRMQPLYWLPLLFLIWANCHIQFVYGIFVVGLFAGVNLPQELGARVGFTPDSVLPSRLSSVKLLLIFAVCFVATCIGPYSYHLYVTAFHYAGAKFPYTFVREFNALSFRAVSHYVELLLAGAAFFVLGRSKQVNIFALTLLIVTTVVSFRTMRDSWFLCIAAAACIAESWNRPSLSDDAKLTRDRAETLLENAGLALALAFVMFLIARNTDFNLRGLDEAVSSEFPVKAVNFLRQNPQRGPLYNTFDWGGFLTWYMPDYPVAIDGRTDLYGDDLDLSFFRSENGDAWYGNDPYLNEAGVILLPKAKPLANVLVGDQRFKQIYEDRLAVIFVPRRSDSP